MPRHILIKLTKTKHEERILKAAREKKNNKSSKGKATSNIQGKPCMINGLSFSRNSACWPKENEKIYLKYRKGKIYNQDYCTWQGSHS